MAEDTACPAYSPLIRLFFYQVTFQPIVSAFPVT